MKKKKEFITTEYNLELINKYAKNIDTGLFLLPSPTGSGKMHAIIKFIKRAKNSICCSKSHKFGRF